MSKSNKFLSALAMLGLATAANAGIYEVYSESFDGLSSALNKADVANPAGVNQAANTCLAEAPAVFSQFFAGGLSIQPREESGYYLQFLNNSGRGDRSANIFWGREIWRAAESQDAAINNYEVSFDFQMKNVGAAKSLNLRIGTSSTTAKWVGNGWPNMNVAENPDAINWALTLWEKDANKFAINGDESEEALQDLTPDTWYHLTLTCDSASNKAIYSITNLEDKTVWASGEKTFETGANCVPTGIYLLGGRNGEVVKIDNLVVGKRVAGDVLNLTKPAIYERGLNEEAGTYGYAFKFRPEETLHISFTNGSSALAADGETVLSGDITMNADNLAAGTNVININNAKCTLTCYTSNGDGVSESVELNFEVTATAPSYKLIEIDGDLRTYEFSFQSNEVLNVILPDGVICYNPKNPDAQFEGETTLDATDLTNKTAQLTFGQNATIKIYTNNDKFEAAKSEEVEFTVDARTLTLKEPQFTIAAVNPGYSKSIIVSVDNTTAADGTEISTSPSLYFDYTFTPDEGEVVSGANVASGTKIDLPGPGILVATSTSASFNSSEQTTYANIEKYRLVKEIDFEHMTAETLLAKGFTKLETTEDQIADLYCRSYTSGEDNWTARKRIYDVIIDEQGDSVSTYYRPGGLLEGVAPYNGSTKVLDEANKGLFPGVYRYEYPTKANEIEPEVAASLFAPLVLPNKDLTSKAMPLQVKVGIGLVTNGTAENNTKFALSGLKDNEFAVIYKINGYGANSIHHRVTSIAESDALGHGQVTDVVKGNGEFELYRIDTAISLVQIMGVDDGSPLPSAIDEKKADVELDNTIYNLAGQKVNPNNLKKGLYIKNGKAFLVK